MLGLITTKRGQLETVNGAARRIEAASRGLPLEQLALSPPWGVRRPSAENLLIEDEQWQKLDVMLETARRL